MSMNVVSVHDHNGRIHGKFTYCEGSHITSFRKRTRTDHLNRTTGGGGGAAASTRHGTLVPHLTGGVEDHAMGVGGEAGPALPLICVTLPNMLYMNVNIRRWVWVWFWEQGATV